jgi:hypothetical protein
MHFLYRHYENVLRHPGSPKLIPCGHTLTSAGAKKKATGKLCHFLYAASLFLLPDKLRSLDERAALLIIA